MDPSKGIFRRRPSSTSTRSRFRGQPASSSASSSPSMSGAVGVANVIATNYAQSCPTSPSHSQAARRSLGGEKIPEDEEIHNPPTTATTITTTAQINNTTAIATTNNGNNANNTIHANTTNNASTTTTTTTSSTTTVTLSPLIATASSSKEAAEYAAAIYDAKREREALQKSPPAARMRNPRVSSAGSRLVSGTAKARAAVSATVAAQQSEIDKGGSRSRDCEGGSGGRRSDGLTQLQRSASTVSGLTVRPYSSPAGLHAYNGKIPGSVPSSAHGSRLDLRELDKGSAIYLGCSAPRNSTLSLSSRTSSGSSAPPSPVRTPPVSPRHSVRRAATMVKKQQQG